MSLQGSLWGVLLLSQADQLRDFTQTRVVFFATVLPFIQKANTASPGEGGSEGVPPFSSGCLGSPSGCSARSGQRVTAWHWRCLSRGSPGGDSGRAIAAHRFPTCCCPPWERRRDPSLRFHFLLRLLLAKILIAVAGFMLMGAT